MNDITFLKRVSLFFSYLPKTIKETFIWFLFSYLIPLLNIGLIWAIQGNKFTMSINIYSIIIITNACFFTSLYHLAFDYEKDSNNSKNEKDRKLVKTINLVTYVATVVLFTVTIIQTEKSFEIFNIQIFKIGAFLTFAIALFLGLISKYDEIEALGLEPAKIGKAQSETKIGNKKIKL
jgi:hypothetical protein